MKFKLNSTEFYKRQNNEILRFVNNRKNSLHICLENNSTNFIYLEKKVDFILVNSKSTVFEQLSNCETSEYDLIVITDIFEITDDIYKLLKFVNQKLSNEGKVLISTLNIKWKIFIKFAEFFKLKNKFNNNSHINLKKIISLSRSCGFEFVYFYTKQIVPFKIFGIGNIINKILEIFFFKINLGIKSYLIFSKLKMKQEKMTKSVIIPAKNEEKNLQLLFSQFPDIDNLNEVVLICAQSKDNTLSVSKEMVTKYKELNITLVEQKSTGKAKGVFEALSYTSGDLIAILDSDISVDPNTLPSFFEIIEKGHADFVNGTRLIYPIEKNSMRYLNKLGNLFFKFVISIVIKNNLSDALCGTKVFKKSHIDNIYEWRNKLNQLDPFGDFDLIFSAAYCGEKILEYPVHYKARIYGTTQINRFRDGFKLAVYFIKSFALFNTSN